MKLAYYIVGSIITLSILIAPTDQVRSMFTNEASSIGYNPSNSFKFNNKKFPTIDKGLVATKSLLVSTKVTSSVNNQSSHTLDQEISQRAGVKPEPHNERITVDVRQAAIEQKNRIKSIQRVVTPQVALIDTTTIDVSDPQFPAIDSILSDQNETATQKSSIVYLNDRQYVDEAIVRQTWLDRTNHLRQELGRDTYMTDSRLDATANARSQGAAQMGSISHRRRSGDSYYNYNRIVQWFKDKGEELSGDPIIFRNISRVTFSESIGRGMYRCNVEDCTQNMIDATRSTWNFFYSERASNGVHYRALTHPRFAIQGLGLGYTNNKYFLTIHYGTEIIGE